MKISPAEIEARLHNELGLDIEVQNASEGLLVSGVVPTPDDRVLAVDFVRSLAEEMPVVDVVDVAGTGRSPLAKAPDFTGSTITVPADEAARPISDVATGADGTERVSSLRDDLNRGERLADAVRDALRLDSLTTGFPIQVEVDGQDVVVAGVVRGLKDATYVEGLVAAIPGVRSVDPRLTVADLPHDPGEHRPGEPVTGSAVMPDDEPAQGREGLDALARVIEGPTSVEPNDERASGGRPYGSDDVTTAYDRSMARTWDEILDWLGHPTGLAEAARTAMVEDFTALRDRGEPFPDDGGQLFDDAMRAHVSTNPPESPRDDRRA